MGRKNIRFKSEELKKRQDAAAFLRAFADKLDKNAVHLRRGIDEVRLNIPDTIVFSLESEEKKKRGKIRHSFEIELEWVEGEHSTSTVTLA